MADISKPQHPPLKSHHHPLNNNNDNLDNVVDDYVSYIFNPDPFSPPNSSLFINSSSSSSNNNIIQLVNSDSCSCCSSEPDSETHCQDSSLYPDCLYGDDDGYDHMDFITDLFEPRGERERFSRFSDRVSGSGFGGPSNGIEELGLQLGNQESGGSGGGGGSGGLRVARIESDSDTEELSEVTDRNDVSLERFWECPSFDDDTERVDERDGLSSVIDRIEEISVSSDGEHTVGVLEWEILMAVNNLERDLEAATDGGEGFVYTPEFDTLIGQFVETVRALRGSPPAAKAVIDNLPSVVLRIGDMEEDGNVVCAVCKDDVLMGEEVTELPCKHHYHGECIVPWLSIRNTCPVCRFELPTDDVDYERSKNRVDDDDDDDDSRVGYGLDLSP